MRVRAVAIAVASFLAFALLMALCFYVTAVLLFEDDPSVVRAVFFGFAIAGAETALDWRRRRRTPRQVSTAPQRAE